MRILIVEDDEGMRESLTLSLQRDNHEIAGVASAEAALPAIQAREDAIDLVLSDLQLPGADGLTLLARLNQARSAVPFVLMTAHGDLDSAIKALRLGAIDFMPKPFGKKDLRDVLAKVTSAQERLPDGRPQFLEDTLTLRVPPARPAVLAAVDRVYRHFAPALSHLRQPARLLQSALHHAATNALEHGSPTGSTSILITAKLDHQAFEMTVQDQGQGFDHAHYTKQKFTTIPIGAGKGIPIITSAVTEATWTTGTGTKVVMRQVLDT